MFEDRVGQWMQTASGRKFWPMDPRPEDVFIEDIAHALSMMCRFGGHCLEFYSVAQHSVLISRHLPAPYKLWGLLHDASEAYVVDLPRPLKASLPDYKVAENLVMSAIAERFGLCPVMPPEVKRADIAILADEVARLMAPPPEPWDLQEPPLGIDIRPWFPDRAKAEFMMAFRTLTAPPVCPLHNGFPIGVPHELPL